jgi:hypothetical protein
VHTGDGIERVSGADALPAPYGGEGGSVLQALGSKAEERAKRRKKKKDSYSKYLAGDKWKKIRALVLERDKKRCRACGKRAQVVHHIRYPKNLGEEKLEWLFSLCAPCHDEIHRIAATMPLRKATDLVIGSYRDGKVVRLPDDPRLSKREARLRQRKSKGHSKRKVRKVKSRVIVKKESKISLENDRLHAFFKENRERRERRFGT